MLKYLRENWLFIFIGMFPGLFFDHGIDTWEWWVVVPILTIGIYDIRWSKNENIK